VPLPSRVVLVEAVSSELLDSAVPVVPAVPAVVEGLGEVVVLIGAVCAGGDGGVPVVLEDGGCALGRAVAMATTTKTTAATAPEPRMTERLRLGLMAVGSGFHDLRLPRAVRSAPLRD